MTEAAANFDLVLAGATLVDPDQGTVGVVDIGVRDGVIAEIGTGLSGRGETIDSTGQYVAPGFIDAHTHIFEHVSSVGAPVGPAHLDRGVVACADAGTAGASTFAAFNEYVVKPTPVRVVSFLNVSVLGLIDFRFGELLNPDTLCPEDALEVAREYPELVRGLKIRLSEDVVGDNCLPLLREAVQIGVDANLPVMVHIGHTHDPLPAILDEMRAGDVVSHCYTGKRDGILGEEGVLKEVVAARDRGVVFDSAHGRGNLSFNVARTALDEGFLPDVVSSDTSARNWHGPVFDLATTMSKFLALGMSLDQVITLATTAPAQLLGLDSEGFGRVAVGGPAHLTTFSMIDDQEFQDVDGVKIRGPRIEPTAAIVGGVVHQAAPWRGLADAAS